MKEREMREIARKGNEHRKKIIRNGCARKRKERRKKEQQK